MTNNIHANRFLAGKGNIGEQDILPERPDLYVRRGREVNLDL